MDIELNLKVSKTIDDLHSTNFWIAKDRAVPVFLSQETPTMFFLTAYLRGYSKSNIKIDINEDGTLISISGNKMVQETMMKGWVMYKEEPEVKGFMKMYKIPSGVVLDKIKADYNEDELKLTIYMPKHKKGIVGDEIEQVHYEEQVNEESLQEEQVSDDEDDNDDDFDQEEITRVQSSEINEVNLGLKGKIHDEEKLNEEDEQVLLSQDRKGKNEQEDKDEKSISEEHELEEGNDDNKCMLFAPCFFIGSTLIASLVTLLHSLVKTKKTIAACLITGYKCRY